MHDSNTGVQHKGILQFGLADVILENGLDVGGAGYYLQIKNFYNTGYTNSLHISSNGNVGIGTMSPDARLTVNGNIHATEVQVTTTVPTPDYVFEKSYDLPTLDELNAYVTQNKHLPDVPSAKEMEANGILLGEMNIPLYFSYTYKEVLGVSVRVF